MTGMVSEQQSDHPKVNYLGMRFDALDLEQAIEAILDARGPFRYVVTPNVQHMVNWIENPDQFGPLYEDAWLSLCDGQFIPLLARFSSLRLSPASGSDLTERLIPLAAREGFPITVIGPPAEDIELLCQRYPGLVVNSHCPPFGFIKRDAEVQACLDFVAAHPARLVFLGVGTPRQEILARLLLQDGRAEGVGLCIGASIDYLVGRQARAPVWMQKAYLEWLHRLSSDPKRLAGRYLVQGPRIFYHAMRYEMAGKRRMRMPDRP